MVKAATAEKTNSTRASSSAATFAPEPHGFSDVGQNCDRIGTRTRLSGYPTNQELQRCCIPILQHQCLARIRAPI